MEADRKGPENSSLERYTKLRGGKSSEETVSGV